MLRVTLEVIPNGDYKKSRIVDRFEIANDLSSRTPEHGNYEVRRDGGELLTRVYAYRKSLGPWGLVSHALNLGIAGKP